MIGRRGTLLDDDRINSEAVEQKSHGQTDRTSSTIKTDVRLVSVATSMLVSSAVFSL